MAAHVGEQLATRGAEDPFGLDHSVAIGAARSDQVGLEHGLANQGQPLLGGERRRSDDAEDDDGQREEDRRGEDDEGRGTVRGREVRRPATHVDEGPVRNRQPDDDDVSLYQVSCKADRRVREEGIEGIADRRPDRAHRARGIGSATVPVLRIVDARIGAISFLRAVATRSPGGVSRTLVSSCGRNAERHGLAAALQESAVIRNGTSYLRCARKAVRAVVGPVGNPPGRIMVEERGKDKRPIR
jgi:hypothetical protein